jgi:protocatechuate 3,4-dioxygenase beta subunit
MQLKSLNEDGSISYQFSKRKAIMHNIRAFFIIVAVVSIGMAQTVTISGKVIDMSGLPLSGANSNYWK